MYKWYYGTNNVPEYKADAIAQMVLGIGTGCAITVVLLVMAARWFLGL